MDDPDLRPNPPTPDQAADNPPTLAAESDVAAEHQARMDYYKGIVPQRKKRRGLKVFGIVVLVLVVLAAAGGAYWHFTTSKPLAKNNPIAQHQAKSQAESAANQKVPTTAYSSANFGVDINYPTAWTVASDTPALLSITSPITQITDATGAAVSGKVVMNMVPKGQLPPAFGAGATAVLDSAKVDYTQPTPSQRASTYLSFAQYSATKASGALDGIYVTGNFGYKKLQNIPSTDIANVDPLITVVFEKCADTTCTANLTPLSIKATDWNDSTFSAPIKTLLTSLAFN